MEGSASRICQADGEWNTTIPVCHVVECPRPSIVNGSPDTFVREFGTVVNFSCRSRHRLEGKANKADCYINIDVFLLSIVTLLIVQNLHSQLYI